MLGAAAPEAQLLAACDKAISARLKSPSSYRRIDALPYRPSHLSPEAAAGDGADPREVAVYARMGGAWRHRIMIEYDAANAYGTPMRAAATCDYLGFSEAPPDKVTDTLIRIDGQTDSDWLIRGLGG